MAQCISIHDTHRLPYPNAIITATKLNGGETDRLEFFPYNADEGESYGHTIYTNASGYLCDGSGTVYNRGAFLKESAVVKATFRDGNSTTWEVGADDSVEIGDGKLMGEDMAGNPVQVFSANQSGDSDFDYRLLKNRPNVNEWCERHVHITLTQSEDTWNVDMFAKTAVIDALTGTAATANNVSLKLVANSERCAQILCIRNMAEKSVTLLNPDGSFVERVDSGENVTIAYLGQGGVWVRATDVHKFTGGTGRGLVTWPKNATTQKAENVVSYNISDDTPDLVLVTVPSDVVFADYPSNTLILTLSELKDPRKFVKIWWQPVSDPKPIDIGFSTVIGGVQRTLRVGTLMPYSIGEICVSDGSIFPVSNFLPNTGSSSVINRTLTQSGFGYSGIKYAVPPMVDVLNLTVNTTDNFVDIYFPESGMGRTALLIANTGSTGVTVRLTGATALGPQFSIYVPAGLTVQYLVEYLNGHVLTRFAQQEVLRLGLGDGSFTHHSKAGQFQPPDGDGKNSYAIANNFAVDTAFIDIDYPTLGLPHVMSTGTSVEILLNYPKDGAQHEVIVHFPAKVDTGADNDMTIALRHTDEGWTTFSGVPDSEKWTMPRAQMGVNPGFGYSPEHSVAFKVKWDTDHTVVDPNVRYVP